MRSVLLILGAVVTNLVVLLATSAVADAATLTVNTTDDSAPALDGFCTLREAITRINAGSDGLGCNNSVVDPYGTNDTILFAIPDADPNVDPTTRVRTITINPALNGGTGFPAIDKTIVINGYSQTNAAPPFAATPNTNPITQGSNARLLVQISGPDINGSILFLKGRNSEVRGLVINRSGENVAGSDGIGLRLSNRNQMEIQGNFIGTDPTGTLDRGNRRRGIVINANSDRNLIGGDQPADRNVISGNDETGIYVISNQNGILGNLIGTNAAGTAALPNANSGVVLDSGSDNVIGGNTTPNERNIISGNGSRGVRMTNGCGCGGPNIVAGNYIGLGVDGTTPIPNQDGGVRLENGATFNFIGGPDASFANVISSNGTNGIGIFDAGLGNEIGFNLIGTDATGTLPRGNGTNGIRIDGQFGPTGLNEIVGNTIAASGQNGILLSGQFNFQNGIGANYIGTNAAGASGLGNAGHGIRIEDSLANVVSPPPIPPLLGNVITANGGDGVSIVSVCGCTIANMISQNSIFGNAGLGIDLGDDGPTANDPQDADAGPNDLQNTPTMLTAVKTPNDGGVTGTINSTPLENFDIEIFSSASCDPSGFGEGQTYLGTVNVTTDGNGDAPFSLAGLNLTVGQRITATATDTSFPNTSEFSNCVTVISTDGIVSGDASIAEPPSGNAVLTFTVTMPNPSLATVTVQFTTANGPAGLNGAQGGTSCTGDVDFINTSGTLIFEPGQTSKPVNVTVCADQRDELTETFTLNLSGPQNALLSKTTLTGTIRDTDVTPCVTTLMTGIPVGTTTLPVFSFFGCNIGDTIVIGQGTPQQETRTIRGFGSILITEPTSLPHQAGETVARIETVNPTTPPSDDDNDKPKPKKETEEQRQQRERTNRGGRADVAIEGNVLAVEKAADGKSILATVGLTRGETQVVQVPCFKDGNCHDIRVGDYLEADGYQNGVGDPNTYFVAENGATITRNGKRVK